MKFGTIIRFEFKYQLRHVSTWLLFLVFLLFGFGVLRLVTLTEGTYLNAPGTIAFFTVFGSAIWLVIGGVVVGDAATRDVHTRMHPLTFTTPVSKLSYLRARFVAALALNVLVLLVLYAGMLLSYYGPGARTEFIGPFRLASYLTNFAFIALPTVLVTTAIQFAFAALSGRAIASYIASIFIIIFSQFGGTTVRFALEWKVLGSLMDLLGTSIIAEMEGWTPIDANTRLILLEGTWLWNRVMWLGIAGAALAFTYFRFRLAHVMSNGGLSGLFRRRPASVRAAAQDTPDVFPTQIQNTVASAVKVLRIPRSFNLATHGRQVLAMAGASFWSIAKSRGGLTLVAILSIGTGLFATEYMEFLGVPLLARTQEVLRVLTTPLSSFRTPWIIIPLLTIFYAGELVWREREAGLHELADTAPVPEGVMFLGKYIGLALIIAAWMAFLMGAGIINQLVMGYYHFEIGVYLKALFGIQLTNYLLFALLVYVIHVLIHQKYIGHIVAFGAYGYLLFSSLLGVEHHMLVYASDPGWAYSDMSGFGPFVTPWLWFKLYWASWAFLLGVLAILFWVRSKEAGLTARLRGAQQLLPKYKVALAMALTLVLLSGGFVFYNTNLLNTYTTREERMELRADYEHRYGQYKNTPQPTLARTKLHVEIYPDHQAADIQGTYQLVNRSKAVIDSIHLSTIPHLQISEISFDRTATPAVVDEHLGYRMYTLKKGLAPGDSVLLSFKMQIKPNGFSNEGVDASVVANGTHFESDWMPVVGYNENRRLREARDREKYGLAPRPERPSLYDVAARYEARHAQLMDFEAVVGTAKDQIAVAPGTLRRTWTAGSSSGSGEERRYFHYVTNAPISHEYAFFSARYAVREAQWIPPTTTSATPVTIQIFYHPTHNANIDRMLKSAQASLQYYSREFGPYPYRYFRVLERPGPGRGMHAEAMTIDYPEGYSLMNPKPGGLDLPYHIMAHEVAHQWWGFRLAPAAVEGAGLLVESLATYSAMQVVEETLGYGHLLRYLSQMRLEYEVPRSRAAPPLLRSNNAFMNYRKGPFALFALRNYIGKEKVNDALRAMLRNYTPNPPLPTTLDFYRELQAVTPDSLHYLVHDLFAENTFWELETKQATAAPAAAGTWQVTLDVQARQVTVDSLGVEKNVSMWDWIEIGVYAPRTAGDSTARVLYLQKHRLRSGPQKVILHVPEQPARAGIDPNHLLIDLDMGDNIMEVRNNL
jgi:ABC-2 type transport system permease protein